MIEYEFYNEEGEYRTIFMRWEDVPKIGEIIEHEGEELRRVASVPGVAMGFKPFVSHSLAPNDPNASVYDRQGRPCFNTEKSVRDYLAKANSRCSDKKLVWDK